MVTGQHEGMVLLIFGVNTLAQPSELALEFTSSTSKIPRWNIQGVQPIFGARVQEQVVARKFLDAEVMAPKTRHRGQ